MERGKYGRSHPHTLATTGACWQRPFPTQLIFFQRIERREIRPFATPHFSRDWFLLATAVDHPAYLSFAG
ncbi:MAG: hypothetical protein IT327_09180 [Anaerolineae bacterium]|nr:hypothetical protein [Anaerolineae bacterium]